MTLRDFAYGTLILGKPLVLWLGLLALALLLSAAVMMHLNKRLKFAFELHKKVAFAGLAIAIIHMILALTAYF